MSSVVAPSEHGLFDLLGDDGADFAEVFADRLDLQRHPHQELQVGFHVTEYQCATEWSGFARLACNPWPTKW